MWALYSRQDHVRTRQGQEGGGAEGRRRLRWPCCDYLQEWRASAARSGEADFMLCKQLCQSKLAKSQRNEKHLQQCSRPPLA